MVRRICLPRLLIMLILVFVMPVIAAEGKKSKFLAAYPSVFKFVLFWWCVFVFAVMGVYILDHVLFRLYGPAKVFWDVEHVFTGSASREQYWKQLSDPSSWSTKHPVLQSADVRMMQCAAAEEMEADSAEPLRHLRPVPLGPLKPGFGLILRYKAGSGPREGSFFCTRECVKLEVAEGEPWRLTMRTMEAGAGYPFLPNTEVSEVEMLPPSEDGSVRCKMTGLAFVTSRAFRWWTKLQPLAQLGAEDMLRSIGEEVTAPKKRD